MFDPKELSHAYKFLANYNLKIENFEEAYIAAQKCIEFPEVMLKLCIHVRYNDTYTQ